MRSKNTLEHFFLTELKMDKKQVVNLGNLKEIKSLRNICKKERDKKL